MKSKFALQASNIKPSDYLLIVIGSFLQALSYVLFLAPYKIVPGGVYGISIVLHYSTKGLIPLLPEGLPIGATALCFNIPLITFEDVPGFLPGTIQEHNGIIRHGAKIVYAYAEATVPKVTLITRKAYGGAYIVMSSKPTGADVNLAYPQAEIAVMGAAGAVNILYRKSTPEEKQEIIKDYEDKFSNPYCAAERGLIDEVIMPRDTRYKLIQALEMCHNKNQSNPPKKHGNMPL